MTKFTKLVGAAAILMGSCVASGAYADASATTCGQFAMMDDAARLNYAHELLLWIADTANSEAAGAELIGQYGLGAHDEATANSDVLNGDPTGPWTHAQMKVVIEAHCIRHPAGSNIVERLKNS